MIQRACCLILLGGLEFGWGAVSAQEAPIVDEDERFGGFELVRDVDPQRPEDASIFTPLSPVVVEAEPVKLPDDQAVE